MPGFNYTKKYLYIVVSFLLFFLIVVGAIIVVRNKSHERVLSYKSENTEIVSPSKNAIAYVSDRDGNNEIYLQNSTDNKIQRITDTVNPEFAPVLSSDGRKLAYFSQEDGFNGIWNYSLENQQKKLLSITRAEPVMMQYSPDGLLIAYLEINNGKSDLYIINTTTGFKERVATGASDFSWSIDSSSIVYAVNTLSDLNKSEIVIRTFDERGELENPVTLFIGGVAPLFASDGNRIYFIDMSSEYITLASTSLRGEGYYEEFQIRIQPKNDILYKLSKNIQGDKLLLTMSTDMTIVEALYIALDDKVALPIANEVTAVAWDNVSGIIMVERDSDGYNQVWKKNNYDDDPEKLTTNNNNWF